MILIQSITISGTATTSVSFTSIPQDGTHLVLVGSARNSSANSPSMNISGSGSGDGYNLNGSSASNITLPLPSNATPDFYSGIYAMWTDYTTNARKTVLSDGTNPVTNLSIRVGLSTSSTAAVTAVTMTNSAGGNSFADQSRFSLYKITAGTGGATFS